ncbi:MAG: oligosaccharide flippase family protein, partial [bacterium]
LPLYLLTLLAWVFWQGDDFIVGLIGDRTMFLAGNAALGFYSLAFYFPHQLMKIRSELAGVSFPAFSALRDDMKRLSSAYKAVTRNAAIFMLSFGAVLIPLARPTILYLLGEKWLPSVNAFKIFMVVAMVRAIFANWGEVYKSLGKTRALLWTYIPNPLLLLVLGPFVTLRFGILGMSLLIMGIVVAMQPLVIFLTKRVLPEVSFTRLLWKPAVVFAIVLLLAYGILGFIKTRHAFVVGASALYILYYALMAAFDGQFRMAASDYLRTSMARRRGP